MSVETSAHFKQIRKRQRVTERDREREKCRREPTFTTALSPAHHKMAVHHLFCMNKGHLL